MGSIRSIGPIGPVVVMFTCLLSALFYAGTYVICGDA